MLENLPNNQAKNSRCSKLWSVYNVDQAGVRLSNHFGRMPEYRLKSQTLSMKPFKVVLVRNSKIETWISKPGLVPTHIGQKER